MKPSDDAHSPMQIEKKTETKKRGPDLEIVCEEEKKQNTRDQKQINKASNRNRCWCCYLNSLLVVVVVVFISQRFVWCFREIVVLMCEFYIRISSHQYLSIECLFTSILAFNSYNSSFCVHTVLLYNLASINQIDKTDEKMNERTNKNSE